jgi:hypothetical protein
MAGHRLGPLGIGGLLVLKALEAKNCGCGDGSRDYRRRGELHL